MMIERSAGCFVCVCVAIPMMICEAQQGCTQVWQLEIGCSLSLSLQMLVKNFLACGELEAR